MSKRELVVALLDSWFPGGMLVKDAHHRAKARLLNSGKSEFMSSMGDVYQEMSTRTIGSGRAHLVAFLPDVLYKTKPFVRFVRKVQRHCTGRRPLFSVRTKQHSEEASSLSASRGVTFGGVADKVTFETISRQYNVVRRFAVDECVHPEIDGWDQDELEVDRKYTPLSGAEWHVTAPNDAFNVDKTNHVGYDGELVGKQTTPAGGSDAVYNAERTKMIDSLCAVVWRDAESPNPDAGLGKKKTVHKREIIGYIANDDTRDFFDVMSCAMETWATNGKMVQPCCLIVDTKVCAPRHLLETIATSGVDESVDDAGIVLAD